MNTLVLLVDDFKTSVNVKLDIGNRNFIKRYLPSPSHAESLIGLANAFSKTDSTNAHIMIGPYGSGKSLIAKVIADFVSNSLPKKDIDLLIKKFEKVHQDVYKSLKSISKLNRNYLPVTLSGYEGSFSEAITRAIVRKMKEEGIEVDLIGERIEIINIVKKWRSEFPQTYEHFLELLKVRGINIDQWLRKLEHPNSNELKWFKEVYPTLTSGASFTIRFKDHFLEQLAIINKKLEEENLGIFIIYDEFGRFLQSVATDEVHKTMQDIQDLAEMAVRSKNLMHLLLISHKNMSQYMLGFHEEYRSEFQRVEKRFLTYFVEGDSATYYRITENYLSKINKEIKGSFDVDKDELMQNLRIFNLFDELNIQEIEKLIVEGSYPIHPMTLYLLPKISKHFGQNERTLFTFLQSNETSGLKNHIKKSNQYYFAYQLFDYFFTNIDEQLLNNDSEPLKIYRKISSNLSREENSLYEKILKFITLWDLSHSNSIYKIDSSLISFALGEEKQKLEVALEEMAKKKFLRFNRILNKWELYEGSPIVVQELIAREKEKLKLNEENRANIAGKMLPKKFFLSTKYNDQKNITRFIRVKLVPSSVLLQDDLINVLAETKKSDGLAFLVALEDKDHYKDLEEVVKGVKEELVFFCFIKEEFKGIQNAIDEEKAIGRLLTDKKLLSEHVLLKEELMIIQEEAKFTIKQFLDKYFRFDGDVIWFFNGKKLKLRNVIEFENYLSEVMNTKFNRTPVIMNDSINRYNINAVQQRALIRVLNGVLTANHLENLGIEGQGPDYLIYATVFKNNGLDVNNLNEIKDRYLSSLRESLLKELRINPKGSLKSLYNILASTPYGIRDPIIPLLFVSLLRDKWDQLMFYSFDMFVPALQAEKIYEMFKEPSEYQYEYHKYSESLLRFMEGIEKVVTDYISEYVLDKTILIKISSGLLNWLRSLPKCIQITETFMEELIELKEIIRKSEVNPLKSIESLFSIYEGNIEALKKDMDLLALGFNQYRNLNENYLLEKLNLRSFSSKKDYLKKFKGKEIINNHLLNVLSKTTNFEQFAADYIGTEMQDWSDTTLALFKKQVENDLQSLENNDSDLVDNLIELMVNNESKFIQKIELSTKSETIFNNVDRIIKNAGRSVAKEEIGYIIFKLIDKYVK